ncbi:MAG: hypothetical protein ACJAT2_000082 [Bacteriovoracaceae bacterium]|jgi:hypothetical protein
MKIALTISILLLSSSLFSAEVYFQGPCDKESFLSAKVSGENLTAGGITISALEDSKTEYIGSEGGLNSVIGTPIGMEAIEVISNTKMRAYGWCYEIDGFQPAAMPDEIVLEGDEVIRWFFAYSTYEDGNWKDYCVPSYELKSPFICPE